MIDALNLVETMPQSANTAYGFVGSPIALPKIFDQLAANDPGLLITTLQGLPAGAVVSDGKNSVTIQANGDALNLTGWSLASVTLTLSSQVAANNGSNTFNLQVVATSVDPTNDSMAGVASEVDAIMLDLTLNLSAQPHLRSCKKIWTVRRLCYRRMCWNRLKPCINGIRILLRNDVVGVLGCVAF